MDNPPATSGIKGIVLVVTTAGGFLTPWMVSSLNIALPTMGREFSMSAVALGWLSTVYILAAAALLVPFAKISDIVGRRRIYVWGALLYCVASLLCAVAPNEAWLLAFRAAQGCGAALMFGTGVAIVSAVFPPGERGRALGINVAATYLGLSVGPVVGGVMTERLGWRSVFIVAAVLAAVVAVLMAFFVKAEWKVPGARGRFDLVGSVVYIISLIGLTWGLSELPSLLGALLLAGGLLAFLLFIWWESKTTSPLLDLWLFRSNRVFALSNLAALINYSATFAVGFLLSLYLQYIRGYSAETAGLILIAQPVLMALFSPWAGRLSDRVEPRLVASTGMMLAVVGLALLIFLGPDTSIVFLLLVLALLGLGFALFSSPNTNTIMSSVQPQHYGLASATLATMRTTGQMVSMALAMLVFAVVVGRVEITPEHYGAFLHAVRLAFGIATAMCVVGTFASLARGNLRS